MYERRSAGCGTHRVEREMTETMHEETGKTHTAKTTWCRNCNKFYEVIYRYEGPKEEQQKTESKKVKPVILKEEMEVVEKPIIKKVIKEEVESAEDLLGEFINNLS